MANNMAEKELVFRAMCKMAQNWYGVDVFSSKSIAESTGLSRYKTMKILHLLRDEGLIKNDCVGRPAVVSHGEYEELECEAMPPLRGFSITKKGSETDIFKQESDAYYKSLAEWANSTINSEQE